MSSASPEFFRCPVSDEQSGGKIHVGRRQFSIRVQETSIDGYTVLVTPREAKKLKVGRPWALHHQGSITEVHPQWFFNSPEGQLQIGLRRLRDLTPSDPTGGSLLVRMGGMKYANPNVSAPIYGGFVLFLFAVLALPGIGDQLGTSTRIQGVIRSIVAGVNETLRNVL